MESLSSFFCLSVQENVIKELVSWLGVQKIGLGKEASVGEIPSWPPISIWEEVAHMQDSCGPLCKYEDILKIPFDIMHLFEEMFIDILSGKENKHMAQLCVGPSYKQFGQLLMPN